MIDLAWTGPSPFLKPKVQKAYTNGLLPRRSIPHQIPVACHGRDICPKSEYVQRRALPGRTKCNTHDLTLQLKTWNTLYAPGNDSHYCCNLR